MNDLEKYIRNIVQTHGAISVARFMQIALQHPDFGYYIKGDPLGINGDFITAPEVSQMFGEMLGVWLALAWKERGSPAPFILLELGPGRGTLMADILRATSHVEGFHRAMRLCLLESNETFRTLQREKLAAFSPAFIGALNELETLPLFAVANEFFDAMPVHQYRKTHQGWREIMVGLKDDGLIFTDNEVSVDLPLPDDLPFYEIAPDALALAQNMAAHIAALDGAALIVDYGHAEPPGCLTLQAVRGHAPCSPLEDPGKVDLTAHVDFGALARIAASEGVALSPVTGQGDFLHAMGIDIRAQKLKKNATPEQSAAIDAAAFRLTDPSAMGALFKVMALNKTDAASLPGFS